MEDKSPILEENKKGNKSCRRFCHPVTVEPVALLYFIAHAPILSILQQYAFYRYSKDYGLPNNDFDGHNHCESNATHSENDLEDEVLGRTSDWLLYFRYVSHIPAIFVTLLLGPLSDRIGRKFLMIIALVATTLDRLTMLIVIYTELDLNFMFFGAILTGLSGGMGTITFSCFAYIADVTPAESRSLRMLILEAAMGVGDAIANIGTGYLINSLGYSYPIVLSMSLLVINVIFIFFCLPESLDISTTTEPSKPSLLSKIWSDIKAIVKVYTTNDVQNRRWKLITVFFMMMYLCICYYGSHDVQTLYMLDPPLCLDSVWIGYFNGLIYVVQKVSSLLVLLLLRHRLSDLILTLIGCASAMMDRLTFGLAVNKLVLFTVIPVGAMTALVSPLLRSYQSKLVGKHEQGTISAGATVGLNAGMMLGTTLCNLLYSHTLHISNGFVFFVEAILIALLISINIVVIIVSKYQEKTKASINHIDSIN